MATASIGGLASGLDTATIISQLISLEALPQVKLKTQLSTEQGKVSALQQLNSRTATLGSIAASLATASSSTGTWSSLKSTSTNSAVSVSATSSAQPGSFTVTVGQVALSHQVAFSQAHAATDVVTGAGNEVLLKRAGQPDVAISTGGGTLTDLTAAINAADEGLRATLIKTGSVGGADQYRLLVESTATGAAETFELTDTAGAPLLGGSSVRAGRDATITVGGIEATSRSNTFTDITPGVTIMLGSNATGTSDIAVTRDPGARSAAVKSLVGEVSGLLEAIAAATAHNADTAKAGVLSGDSSLRRVAGALTAAIYPTDGTSMARFGVELDRTGKLTLDEARFAAAYAEDPDAVTAAFTGANGFAGRVEAVAKSASDKYDGTITGAVTSRNSTITRLTDSIERWDDRLALRRTTLERQYTALETTLSQLNSQAAWLTSQLSNLSSSNE